VEKSKTDILNCLGSESYLRSSLLVLEKNGILKISLFLVYVDMGPGASDSAILAFAFTGTSTIRKWEIKTEQLPCGVNYA
jgi:hypothetical protein